MRLHSFIIDDFLERPDLVRRFILKSPFSEIKSPFDGVTYPGIQEASHAIAFEFRKNLETLMGPITPKATFSRLSVEGNYAPHQAHSDTVMGQYTALIYLNLPEQCQGGTSVLRHIEGFEEETPETIKAELIQKDSNDPGKWDEVSFCEMKFNRLFLIDSKYYHRSEPIGGFGNNASDARLVMIMFFDLA